MQLNTQSFNEAVESIVALFANPKVDHSKAEQILSRHCAALPSKSPRTDLEQARANLEKSEVRLAILETAAARLGLITNPVNRFHQKAVNVLLELSVATPELRAAMPEIAVMPREQALALFRLAIDVNKAHASLQGEDRCPEEFAILEVAAMLLEHSTSENRTREQDEFYAALAFRWEAEQARVRYAPENVAVN